MYHKNLFIGLMLMLSASVFSQGKLDGFKYVIIPKKFDFQKSEDAFEINSLLKFLFEKQGFVALYQDNSFPEELRKNPCLALNTKLINNSNLFKSKLRIELINCSNQVVLQSVDGESREKDFKKGYHESVRNAFKTVENEQYSFSQNSVVMLKQPEKEKIVTVEIEKPLQNEPVKTAEIIIEKPVLSDPKYQEKVPIIAENLKSKKEFTAKGNYQSFNQTIVIQQQGNQFVVLDDKNNVIGILYPTSQSNYFIVKWLQSDENLPKLAFLNEEGNLVIDDKETVVVYKRFNP